MVVMVWGPGKEERPSRAGHCSRAGRRAESLMGIKVQKTLWIENNFEEMNIYCLRWDELPTHHYPCRIFSTGYFAHGDFFYESGFLWGCLEGRLRNVSGWMQSQNRSCGETGMKNGGDFKSVNSRELAEILE